MKPITIVVIDDHPIFRQGIVDTLSIESDILVVGEASSGEQGLALIRAHRPKVAIVDVNLPGMNGHQITKTIVEEKIPTRVILLTAYDDMEQKIHAMRAGASAYCVKDIEPQRFINIIRKVNSGKYVVGEDVFDQAGLMRWLIPLTETALGLYGDPGEPYMPLSTREMEVLSYLTKGMSNKEIARLLGISHQTVKNHVTSILRKLCVEDRTQAVIYALRRGWVRLYRAPKNQGDEKYDEQ